MSRFENQGILVTGGASGIGAATARAFAREGGTVGVADLDLERAEEVVAAIRDAEGSAWAFAVDVADEDVVASMIQEAASANRRTWPP